MAVINSLRETPVALQRNPVVLVPVLVLAALQLPQMLLQAINPLLASVLSAIVSVALIAVFPFFQGGLIGMAAEALDGQTSLGTFIEAGKANYVPILIAYLLLFAVNVVLGAIILAGAGVLGIVLYGFGVGAVGLAIMTVFGLVIAIFGLIYLVVMFFLQFYSHAIVLESVGAIDGLKRSIRRVRKNLMSVLGYSVLVGVLGGLIGLVLGVSSAFTTPGTAAVFDLPEPALWTIVVIALGITGLATIAGGVFAVYSVAFYRRLIPNVDDSDTKGRLERPN